MIVTKCWITPVSSTKMCCSLFVRHVCFQINGEAMADLRLEALDHFTRCLTAFIHDHAPDCCALHLLTGWSTDPCKGLNRNRALKISIRQPKEGKIRNPMRAVRRFIAQIERAALMRYLACEEYDRLYRK